MKAEVTTGFLITIGVMIFQNEEEALVFLPRGISNVGEMLGGFFFWAKLRSYCKRAGFHCHIACVCEVGEDRKNQK